MDKHLCSIKTENIKECADGYGANNSVVNRSYYCVDLFKFLCSLFVVAIHIAPFSSYNQALNYGIQQCLARIAVPYFFIASGFFLFRKIDFNHFDLKVPKNYVIKIFKMYVIWTILYFPLAFHDSILTHPKGLIRGLLSWIKRCVFVGSYTHLWYLNALIVATIILCFLLSKKVKVSHILAMAAVLYLIGLLPQSYFALLKPFSQYPYIGAALKAVQKLIETTRNGLFEGFLFMGLGMLIAYKPIAMSKKKSLLCFAISMVLYAIEVLLLTRNGWIREHDLYLFLVPASFFMFLLSTAIQLKPNAIYKYLRETGVLIFYLHLFIKKIVGKAYSFITGTQMENSLLKYCIIVLITWIAAHLIITISHHKRFLWLQKIYK